MNYYKISPLDTANGIGIRVVLWVCGCQINCKNCHNPELQNFSFGKNFTEENKKELFQLLEKPYINGITFSGGHPFEERNLDSILSLVQEIKIKFPQKTIWFYTGYTWEQCMNNKKIKNILLYTDVLVDGPYIEEKKNISLKWRGSTNQRVIDVQKTLKQEQIILYCK